MIKPFKKTDSVYVALSGGVDSVAISHYYHKKGNLAGCVWYDHDNQIAIEEFKIVSHHCKNFNIPLHIGTFDNLEVKPEPSTSKEKYWSNCRNNYFNQFDKPVVTGHNLSDAVEWFLITCFRGEGHYMTWKNRNVVRPFLTTPKNELVDYAMENNLAWYEDESNKDVTFTARNRIRHNILPEIRSIGMNFDTVVRKNIIRKNMDVK